MQCTVQLQPIGNSLNSIGDLVTANKRFNPSFSPAFFEIIF